MKSYQALVLEEAIKKAKEAPQQLHFDPQGRVLVEVEVSVKQHDLLPAMPRTCLVSLDCFAIEGLREHLDKVSEAGRSSIIPLQQEIEMHVRLAARVLQKAVDGTEAQWSKIREAVNKVVNEKIKIVMASVTDKSDIATLNQVLDKARKSITHFAEKTLVNEARKEFKFSDAAIKKINNHTVTATTATRSDFLHTDSSLGLATFISGSNITAHDKQLGAEHMATRQVQQFPYVSENIFLQPTNIHIRVPSIAPKEKDTKTAIDDIAAKLEHIKTTYQAPGKNHFVYNLLTALNGTGLVDRVDERMNKQRQSADRILKGAHQYNRTQLKAEQPFYCYVQNISVNGFGEPLNHDSKNPTVREATIMAEIALLNTLATLSAGMKQIADTANGIYQEFLRTEANSLSVDQIRRIRDQVNLVRKELVPITNSDPITLRTKKALAQLFVRGEHLSHKHAKLMQALSIFVEDVSMSGCKSANERWQAVAGRVGILEAGFTYKDVYDAVIAVANGGKPDVLEAALNKAYDDHGLQAGHSCMSLLDQGGPAKLQSVNQRGWLPNTNFGEADLKNLHQTQASGMQAHKGLAKRLVQEVTGNRSFSLGTKVLLVVATAGAAVALSMVLAPVMALAALVIPMVATVGRLIRNQVVKASRQRESGVTLEPTVPVEPVMLQREPGHHPVVAPAPDSTAAPDPSGPPEPRF